MINNITLKSSEQEKFYQGIKDKLKDNDYIIGLDLGVGSIGFSIISTKKEDREMPDEIVLAGSRVFTPSQGASERREKRLSRNAHRHKRERLFKLWKTLSSKGLSLPAPERLEKENPIEGDTSRKRFSMEVLSKNVYELRYKALYEKLNLMEIGYVIYHLANHRGSASLRTFEELDENKKKENKKLQEKADNSSKTIKEKGYKTYGEMIYKEKIEGNKKYNLPQIRNRQNNVEFIATRDLIIKELDEILKKQKEFYPDILTDDYIKEIRKMVNYENEKLIPEPGHCPYFKQEKKLPKSHPLNEERRLWEAINNSKIFEPVLSANEITGYKEREFTQDEKEKIFAELMKGNNITPNKVIKLLNLNTSSEIILQGRDKKDQKIIGYKNTKIEQFSFWKKLNEQEKDSFFYDWISSPDDHSLKQTLKTKYKMSDEEITDAIKEIEISSGYAPVGKTAMKILLEYIKQGLSFTEAQDKAIEEGRFSIKEIKVYEKLPYYGEILDDLTQPVICKALSEKFRDKGYKKPETDPDEEKFGRIANPVVHQTLNELRKLINEIIYATGKKPVKINLEVARELKKSLEERERISREQNENEKRRQEIFEKYLKGREIKNKGDLILKFQLLEEQEFRCPYCGESINADDIYNSRVDIDHIFPISESLDNSRNNLVLSHNKCNETKGQNPPYNIFSKDKERWNNILNYINSTPGMKNKKWRFMEGSYEEFIKNKPIEKRFETDTSYISKAAQRYLSCLFEKKSNIVPYKGGLTAQLRLAWGLNHLLIPYIEEYLSEGEKNEFKQLTSFDMKLRKDHRHHAIDAIVIGYATRGYHNLLNRLSAKNYNIDFSKKNWLSELLPPPNNLKPEEFSQMIKEKIKEMVISLKHDHNPNGKLLKDTFYRVYLSNEKYILVSKKEVKDINADNIEKIEKTLTAGKEEVDNLNNDELKRMFNKNISILETIKTNIEKAKNILEEEDKKNKEEGKKTTKLTQQRIMKKALEITGGKYYDITPNKEKGKFFIVKQPTKDRSGCGYDTGDNLCLDLYYNEKGKLCGEVIRKVNYLNKNYQPEYKKKGFKLFERIYTGDILECDVSNDKPSLKSKTANAIGNRVFVKVKTFTEQSLDKIQIQFTNIYASDGNQDSFYISSMQKYNPRKVILTPLGAVKYRSKILKDK